MTGSLQIVSIRVHIILPLLPIIAVWGQTWLFISEEAFPRSIYSRRLLVDSWVPALKIVSVCFNKCWIILSVILILNFIERFHKTWNSVSCDWCRLSVWLCVWLDYIEISSSWLQFERKSQYIIYRQYFL